MSHSKLSRRQMAGLVGGASLLPAVHAAPQRSAPPVSGINDLSALELRNLIRNRKLSAREVMESHLAQIERINPKVNAIVTLVAERALANARRADELQAKGGEIGPLHGLPTAHKDLVNTKGVRTTFGSRILKNNVPTEDDIIVERMRDAGAIMVGKTNTPEFGAGSQTFNEVFGATKNPYDVTKTCGGSSGGAAVSLACRMLPIVDGSDAGGSLRNPAAYCNVIGFRTAPGRVPSTGWSSIPVLGPMARTVPDIALLLSVLAGPDRRCPISITEPGSMFLSYLGRNFKDVKVAWFKTLGGLPIDPRVLAAVNTQRRTFEELGCTVEEAEPDFEGVDKAFKTFRTWERATTFGARVREHKDLIKDTILWEYEQGLKLTPDDIGAAETQHRVSWQRMRAFMEKYEYFILPTTQLPPFPVTTPYPKEINGVTMETYIDWMKVCYYVSFVENPSISVPAGFTPEGLPVGLQIVGRHRSELSVLQLALAYTDATRFAERKPSIL